MATDFEIHFGTINRPRAEIIKSYDDFFPSLGIQHETRRHHDGRFPGDLLVLGLDVRCIEKDDPKGRQLVHFTERRLTRHAAGKDDQHRRAAQKM